MHAQAFTHRLRNFHAWIKRGKRVLKYHLHMPAHGAQGASLQTSDIIAQQGNLSRICIDEAHNHAGRGGFTATGFADNRQRFPFRDTETYILNCPCYMGFSAPCST